MIIKFWNYHQKQPYYFKLGTDRIVFDGKPLVKKRGWRKPYFDYYCDFIRNECATCK